MFDKTSIQLPISFEFRGYFPNKYRTNVGFKRKLSQSQSGDDKILVVRGRGKNVYLLHLSNKPRKYDIKKDIVNLNNNVLSKV